MTRKHALALSAFALLPVVGLSFWLGCQDFPQQLQRLPDGSTVQLLGVTHPGKPEVLSGPPLFRLFAPIIPPEHRERLGLATYPVWPDPLFSGAATNSLTVWLRFSDSPQRESSITMGTGVLRVWDEDGNCATSDVDSFFVTDYHPVHPLVLENFPRQGKELRLEVFGDVESSGATHLASFVVANPVQGQYRDWKASSLPCSGRDREFVATLEHLETGLPAVKPASKLRGEPLLQSGRPVWTRALFSCREGKRPSPGWEVERLTISDATGNSFSPNIENQVHSAGKLEVRFAENLWNEPAWKLKVRFRQVNHFPKSRLFSFRTVLPRTGSFRPGLEITRGKTKLHMLSLTGKDTEWSYHSASIVASWYVPMAVVRLTGTPPDAGAALVAAEAGKIRIDGMDSWEDLEKGVFPCQLPDGLRPGPVRLTFAVKETREVTFQVRPTIH